MNLIKKEDEANIPKKDYPEMIDDLFRFFLLLISEEYEKIPNQKLVEEMFDNVFPKYKIDSLSNFNL